MIKKVLKIVGLILLVLFVIIVILAARFCYNNLHWWEKDMKRIEKLGVEEKQVTLPNGHVMNYGELEGDGPTLLLIHGQMAAWENYSGVMGDLASKWHIYAIDLYGHGESSHEEELYYLDVNGDDIIWFINHVIKEETVVSGHSNGAITAGYVAAYGGDYIKGVILEDPPIFSTQGENWENSFAYLDTYRNVHNYLAEGNGECWPSYYLRNCYWGQLFMKDSIGKIADYAKKYSEKHPGEEVKIFFMPEGVTGVFHYVNQYDMRYGEHFYDLTWSKAITHEQMLSDIKVPCIYLHATESVAENGVYLCAASKEQADRAVSLIGTNCTLIESGTSDHCIHDVHRELFLDAINRLK
ncbi:MAG: alpha/beta hydrolase [bacterium]|nr:alpha/beta hydrolase [bacterium]